MTKHAQNRKRFGRRNFKQRYFRLTTRSLSYSKAKGKRPICDIPLTELVAVERLQERSFKMQNIFRVSGDAVNHKCECVNKSVRQCNTHNHSIPSCVLLWWGIVNHRRRSILETFLPCCYLHLWTWWMMLMNPDAGQRYCVTNGSFAAKSIGKLLQLRNWINDLDSLSLLLFNDGTGYANCWLVPSHHHLQLLTLLRNY